MLTNCRACWEMLGCHDHLNHGRGLKMYFNISFQLYKTAALSLQHTHTPGDEQLEVMDGRLPGLVRSKLCANSILVNAFKMLKRTDKLATGAWTGLTCPGESHAGKCAPVRFVVRWLGAKKIQFGVKTTLIIKIIIITLCSPSHSDV